MAPRPTSDVEGQTNRMLQRWARSHPIDQDRGPQPPKEFNAAPILGVLGVFVVLIVAVVMFQSQSGTPSKEEVAQREAQRKAELKRERARTARERRAAAKRKAREEAAWQKRLLMDLKADELAELKREEEAVAAAARREKELAARQAEEKERAKREVATGPLRKMQRGLEALGRANDLYARYALGHYYYGKNTDKETSGFAKDTMRTASYVIHRARTTYPALRVTKPVALDRIVTVDGTELVGRIMGESPNAVLLDFPLSPESRPRTVPREKIRNMGRVSVAPEKINRSRLTTLGQAFLMMGQAKRHVAVLAAWGRLCCEFPDDEPAQVIAGVAPARTARETDEMIETFLDEAADWAAVVCPKCLEGKTDSCGTCAGRGIVTAQVVCPECKGKEGNCPACPSPRFDMTDWDTENPEPHRKGIAAPTHRYRYRGIPGTVYCPLCKGTGKLRGTGVRVFGYSGTCPRCGGSGEVPCPRRCKERTDVCPRCADRRKSTLRKICEACKGTRRTPCTGCGGSGLRPPEPEGLAVQPGKR